MSHNWFKDNAEDKYKPLKLKCPAFTFKYTMLDHSTYGFKYFSSEWRNAHGAYKGLIDKLASLSSTEINTVLGDPKKTGLETIPMKRLAIPIQNAVKGISEDRNKAEPKLAVFRFKNDTINTEHRLICLQDYRDQALFHIIGFDFNFSAYNHG